MADPTNTTLDDLELGPGVAGELLTMNTKISDAIDNGIAALESEPIGDFGIVVRHPDHVKVTTIDTRQHEEFPRNRRHHEQIVGVESFCAHITEFRIPDQTRVYVGDVYGQADRLMRADHQVAICWFDDFVAGDDPDPRARLHSAGLTLRPTASARRWGTALASTLSQEQFLDLVTDGVGEIAEPEHGVLKDLASNLHASRSTEVKSVIRTGGQGSIELSDNVTLAAGSGNRVDFPEALTLVLTPFAGIDQTITVKVKVAPKVRGDAVTFDLTAPDLDDALAFVVRGIADEITAATELGVTWTP